VSERSDEWLTLPEASARLRLPQRWLAQLLEDGRVKGRKLGSEWQVREGDLQTFFDGADLTPPPYPTKENTLEWPTISEKFEEILIAIPNRLDRVPFPALTPYGGLQEFLKYHALVVGHTNRVIRYVASDSKEDPGRRPEYLVTLAPLVRTLLESVVQTRYLLDDLDARWPAYKKAGWRHLHEEHERYKNEFGADDRFNSFLSFQALSLSWAESMGALTDSEKAAPSSVPYWPNPGKMARLSNAKPATQRFLEYLNLWFYSDLSSASHLSFKGTLDQGGFLKMLGEEHRDFAILKTRSTIAFRALALTLAFFSELESAVEFGLGIRAKLDFLWNQISTRQAEVGVLYDMRYRELLGVGGASSATAPPAIG
jgi:hypothetical protein